MGACMGSLHVKPRPWFRPRFLLLLALVLTVAAPVLLFNRPTAPSPRPTPGDGGQGAIAPFSAHFTPAGIDVLDPGTIRVGTLVTNNTSDTGTASCSIQVANPVHTSSSPQLEAAGLDFDTPPLGPGRSEVFTHTFTGDIAILVNSVATGTTYPKSAGIGASTVSCFQTSPPSTYVSWDQRYPGVSKPVFTFLTHVSCSSLHSCMAIGTRYGPHENGWVAEHWDGRGWQTVYATHALRAVLSGVSCPSSTRCLLLGQSGGQDSYTFARLWAGGPVTTPVPIDLGSAELTGLACTGPQSCVAVGSELRGTVRSLAAHWNGSVWTVMPSTVTTSRYLNLTDVSCTSASRCVAIGEGGYPAWTFAERWNGSAWSFMSMPQAAYQGLPPGSTLVEPPRPELTALSCGTATSCLAIGTLGFAERWDGTDWAIIAKPPLQASGVSCASTTTCVIVGLTRHGDVTRATAFLWNGTTWRDVSPRPRPLLALGAGFADISCVDADACVATGSVVRYPVSGANSVGLWGRWSGRAWTSLRT